MTGRARPPASKLNFYVAILPGALTQLGAQGQRRHGLLMAKPWKFRPTYGVRLQLLRPFRGTAFFSNRVGTE